jgi:MFS family permease
MTVAIVEKPHSLKRLSAALVFLRQCELLKGAMSSFFARHIEGLPRTYWYLWGAQLVNRAGTIVVPMLTPFLTKYRGLPLPDAALVVSAFGFGALLGNLTGGILADRWGRRATMSFSLGSGAIAMGVMSLAATQTMLALAALALGTFGEMFRPACQAMVADVVPPALRLRAFTLQYWAVNLGFACAALLGGVMAQNHMQLLFIFDAATTLAFLAVVRLAITETRPTLAKTEGHWSQPFVDKTFAPFLVVTLATSMVFIQHLVSMPAAMAADDMGPGAYGVAIALNGVLIVFFQPMMSGWVEHRRPSRVLAFASLLTGLGLGAMAFAHSIGAVLVSVTMWTIGEMLIAPVNSTLVATLAPPHLRGRYQGAFSLTWGIAFSLGPFATRLGSFDTIWALCAIVGGLAAMAQLALDVGHSAPEEERS